MTLNSVSERPEKPFPETGCSGHLFILSAPSGAGKTTLCEALLHLHSDILYSISYTTRKPRKGEKLGVDYFFIEKGDFEKKIKERYWAEWAKVHDHYYGTSSEFLHSELCRGKDILLDIDVQGTRQILKQFPDSVTIFIQPPSMDELRNRLQSRGTDSPDVIEKRMQAAREEMAQKGLYQHIITNDQLSLAIVELTDIVARYRT
jgi:guanylate kinase